MIFFAGSPSASIIVISRESVLRSPADILLSKRSYFSFFCMVFYLEGYFLFLRYQKLGLSFQSRACQLKSKIIVVVTRCFCKNALCQ